MPLWVPCFEPQPYCHVAFTCLCLVLFSGVWRRLGAGKMVLGHGQGGLTSKPRENGARLFSPKAGDGCEIRFASNETMGTKP